MDKTEIGMVLKAADRGAAKSGEEADVQDVLQVAKKEILAPNLKNLWQDAAEFSNANDRLSRTVYDRAQRKMADILGLSVEGHVVGHALVRATEGGYFNAVHKLRKGQAELKCSVLTPRFLAFALLKAAETGNDDILAELLRLTNSAGMALMGHELAKFKEDGYPSVRVSLTKDWQKTVASFKSLLPPSTYLVQYENLELRSANSDQEDIHEATRSCFQIYFIWRLLIVAGCNGHGSVFRELLVKRDELSIRATEGRKALLGYEHPKVTELSKIRSRIDDGFFQLALKVTSKLGIDRLYYELYSTLKEVSIQDSKKISNSAWRCTSRAQFGLWEVLMEVPVLLMELEGSYQDEKDKKQLLRKYHYVKPILPQVMKLNVQFNISVDIQPNFIELNVGINHVRVIVDEQSWEEKRTGHFPTRVALSVTPATASLTSVTMTGSSTNTSYKVGVGEQVRVGVSAAVKAAPTFGISVAGGKSSSSKIEGKPWRMEQLPIYNERGGSFTWILSNLHGASFDRLDPMLYEEKKSIWQFGKRIPVNPLMVLPFGTNGGVNFTGTEFTDTLSWRFAKDLENTMVMFNIEGQVSTTYITQDTFWETRVVPFETKLEQKLEPCGDPAAGDKKKKKKKK